MFESASNTNLYKHLRLMQGLFWTASEVSFSQDREIFNGLDVRLRNAICSVVNFFVHADDLVNDQIETTIMRHITDADRVIRVAYQYIEAIEGIHLQSYSDYVEQVLPQDVANEIKRGTYHLTDRLHAFSTDLYLRYHDNLPMLLVSQIIIEGVFFSGAWLLVFWLKEYYPKLSGFTKANERINKDESTHITWSQILIKHFGYQLDHQVVSKLFDDAVEISIKVYREDVLPDDLDTLNKDMFTRHIKYIADEQLKMLGIKPLYNVGETFSFMQTIEYGIRMTDFFTSTSLEYSKDVTCSGKLNEVDLLDTEFSDESVEYLDNSLADYPCRFKLSEYLGTSKDT